MAAPEVATGDRLIGVRIGGAVPPGAPLAVHFTTLGSLFLPPG
jgi:hypothetical protein